MSTPAAASSPSISSSATSPVVNVCLYSRADVQPATKKAMSEKSVPDKLKSPETEKRMLRDSKIFLGSTSCLKLKAVKEVFVGAECQGCDVKSGVSDQPVGQLETLTGARNRAHQAQKLHSDAFLWIGIENGMIHIKEMGVECQSARSQWVDVAAIVIISAQGKEWVIWSEAIEIPAGNIPKCLNEQTGQAFDVWSPLKDPHSKYVNRPRSDFLRAAMYDWFVAHLSFGAE